MIINHARRCSTVFDNIRCRPAARGMHASSELLRPLFCIMNASQTFIMFAMTVYKCGTTLQRYEAGVMQMWKLFLRDGVLWFLAVFGEYTCPFWINCSVADISIYWAEAAAGAALLIWTMQRETLKQLLVVCVSLFPLFDLVVERPADLPLCKLSILPCPPT